MTVTCQDAQHLYLMLGIVSSFMMNEKVTTLEQILC